MTFTYKSVSFNKRALGPKVSKTAVSVLLESPRHMINAFGQREVMMSRLRAVPRCVSSPRASRLSAGVCESASTRWPSLPPSQGPRQSFPNRSLFTAQESETAGQSI